MSYRKRSSISWPCWVCATSGWNCTPARLAVRFSNAATGAPAEDAVTVKPCGAIGHAVAVAHPDRQVRGQLTRAACRPGWSRTVRAVLAGAGVRDRAAERLRHRLEAVADAEHRHVAVEQAGVEPGGARLVHTGRPAGQDDRRRVLRQHLGHRHRVRHDLGVDPRLTDPPGDELGVLGAEVDNEHGPGGRHDGRVYRRPRRRFRAGCGVDLSSPHAKQADGLGGGRDRGRPGADRGRHRRRPGLPDRPAAGRRARGRAVRRAHLGQPGAARRRRTSPARSTC